MIKHTDEILSSAIHKKTLDHNYLIFHMPDDSGIDYQLNMISSNDICGLLPISPHLDRDGAWLYYDHSSLQPLSRMFETRKISDRQTRELFGRILDIYRSMNSFLLDDAHLVLDPGYIYVDAYTLKPSLVFLPFYEKTRSESLLALCEFLMEHADHGSETESPVCYELYELLRPDNYVMDDIRRILDKAPAENKEADRLSEALLPDEPQPEETRPSAPAAVKAEADDIKSAKQIPFPFIPLIPLAAGVLIFLIPSSALRINSTGRIAALALALTGAAAFLFSFRSYLRKKKEEKDIKTETKHVNEFDKYFEDLPDINAAPAPLPDEGYGRTVFIGNDTGEPEGILVEKNRKNEYPIPVFPCTIGKLKDSSDLVFNDRSVSRIHAKILKENDQYFLKDCGSTNGTFLNGVQLDSEETVRIEKDDEIGIGRLRFILA